MYEQLRGNIIAKLLDQEYAKKQAATIDDLERRMSEAQSFVDTPAPSTEQQSIGGAMVKRMIEAQRATAAPAPNFEQHYESISRPTPHKRLGSPTHNPKVFNWGD